MRFLPSHIHLRSGQYPPHHSHSPRFWIDAAHHERSRPRWTCKPRSEDSSCSSQIHPWAARSSSEFRACGGKPSLLNRYPPCRDFVWLQILGTCHSSLLTESCKDFQSDAIWIIPAQWGVCVCGGALLPLRGEEDKVIASKKNLHMLSLVRSASCFPDMHNTIYTCSTNAVARMPGYANCRQASNEMKPEQSWSHMFFGCRFSCDRVVPSLMLEVERFQNPWRNPSSWSLVLRDLDSACVKEQKELHVLLVLLFWTWCAWFFPFLQRIVVHDDLSSPRTIHVGSCRHVVAASLLRSIVGASFLCITTCIVTVLLVAVHFCRAHHSNPF